MAFRALLLLVLALPLAAGAAELEGVKMDERLRVGAQELQLNGMALRTRVFFKVYVAGLYLPQKAQDAGQALRMAGPKRMALVLLRDVGADTFVGSLVEGLKQNLSEAEAARLRPQTDELVALMQKIGEAKKGMAIALDFAPGAGTSILVNGVAQGKPIAGDDFSAALLRIWLGEKPVSDDMKKALLGSA
jgi:hypothetical protein